MGPYSLQAFKKEFHTSQTQKMREISAQQEKEASEIKKLEQELAELKKNVQEMRDRDLARSQSGSDSSKKHQEVQKELEKFRTKMDETSEFLERALKATVAKNERQVEALRAEIQGGKVAAPASSNGNRRKAASVSKASAPAPSLSIEESQKQLQTLREEQLERFQELSQKTEKSQEAFAEDLSQLKEKIQTLSGAQGGNSKKIETQLQSAAIKLYQDFSLLSKRHDAFITQLSQRTHSQFAELERQLTEFKKTRSDDLDQAQADLRELKKSVEERASDKDVEDVRGEMSVFSQAIAAKVAKSQKDLEDELKAFKQSLHNFELRRSADVGETQTQFSHLERQVGEAKKSSHESDEGIRQDLQDLKKELKLTAQESSQNDSWLQDQILGTSRQAAERLEVVKGETTQSVQALEGKMDLEFEEVRREAKKIEERATARLEAVKADTAQSVQGVEDRMVSEFESVHREAKKTGHRVDSVEDQSHKLLEKMVLLEEAATAQQQRMQQALGQHKVDLQQDFASEQHKLKQTVAAQEKKLTEKIERLEKSLNALSFSFKRLQAEEGGRFTGGTLPPTLKPTFSRPVVMRTLMVVGVVLCFFSMVGYFQGQNRVELPPPAVALTKTPLAEPAPTPRLTDKEAQLLADLKQQIAQDGSRAAYEKLQSIAVATGNPVMMNAAYEALRESEKALDGQDPFSHFNLVYILNSGEALLDESIPVSKLVEILNTDTNWKKRAMAARYLGATNDPNASPVLASVAKKDPNLYVVKESLRAFEKITGVSLPNSMNVRQMNALLETALPS